jgi:uncharacterized membrane protein YfcA
MTRYFLLLVGGVVSGFIKTLASSGSAISLPIFLFLGFPPHVANATNRLGVLTTACSSTVVFARQGKIDWPHVPHVLAPTVTGAVLGALLADRLSDRDLRTVIILAVVMSLVLVLIGTKRLLGPAPPEHRRFGPPQMVLLFLVGIWTGLIVSDGYTYLLLTLVLAVGYDLAPIRKYLRPPAGDG